jgi:hypothetical protein
MKVFSGVGPFDKYKRKNNKIYDSLLLTYKNTIN